MRFLADVGVGTSVGNTLRGMGHDSIHLIREGLERLLDAEIIEKARVEGRIILTHDLDFCAFACAESFDNSFDSCLSALRYEICVGY